MTAARSTLTPVGVGKFTGYLQRTAREVAGPGLRDVHREVARFAAEASRSEARGMGGLQAKAARAIRGNGNINAARLSISATARTRYASVAYWGAIRFTGWYARMTYRSTTRQHRMWVGSDWRVGVKGEGPYAINNAIAENLDAIEDLFRDRLQALIDS